MMDAGAELSPALCQRLAERNPWGRLDVTAEDVKAWFELIEPSFDCYEYKNRKLAVTNWWRRATEEELERARARVRRIAEELELQRMAELQEAANNVIPLEPTRSLARRVLR